VRREAPVPAADDGLGHWSLDHLFLDGDGVPVLVEVKRATDTRARREVIAQMLDYAANGVAYWPIEQIVEAFNATVVKAGGEPEHRLRQFLHGQGFDHHCAWLDERGYHGTDWYPHDAKFREAEAPGARTRIETLLTLGRKPELVPQQPVMDGIKAGRETIPFAGFDAKRCAQGLESLRAYGVEWDE
jgi:hypothetical protein